MHYHVSVIQRTYIKIEVECFYFFLHFYLFTMVESIVLNLLSLFTLVSIGLAKNVSDIKDCQAFSRRTPSISVYHLRVDDIKAIGALGDR